MLSSSAAGKKKQGETGKERNGVIGVVVKVVVMHGSCFFNARAHPTQLVGSLKRISVSLSPFSFSFFSRYKEREDPGSKIKVMKKTKRTHCLQC